MTTAYTKPLPALEGLNGQFFAWCRQGELRFQRCSDCGTWRHVPREMCAECGAMEWEWARSCGKGRVFTWTTSAVPPHPAFKGAAPYAAVVVEMDEGVRIVTQITDCTPDELEIDMPVTVGFETVTPDVTLPKFRRATA